MADTMVVDAANNTIDIENLSREFGEVVDRIQNEMDGAFAAMSDSDWGRVDRAERVVDECAEDLRVGRCDRTIWLLALESYEKAWGAVLERRVGHQSLAA